MKKRLLCLAITVVTLLSLSGCKMGLEIEVHEEGGATVTESLAISAEDLNELYAESGDDPQELLEQGYELVEIDGEEYYQIVGSEDLEDLAKVTYEDYGYIVKPNYFVMSSDEASEMSYELVEDQGISEEEISQYLIFDLKVTFPATIKVTNGKLSKDKMTASWDLENEDEAFYAYTADYSDTKKPTVTGVKNNETYKKTVTVKYSDASIIAKATLDGKEFDSGKKVSKTGKHTVVVTDVFGNKRTVKFTIKK